MNNLIRLSRVFAILSLMTLSGCHQGTTLQEKLGLSNRGPYEYSVMSYAPLSVPPEFDLPLPVEPNTADVSGKANIDLKTKEILYGTKIGTHTPKGLATLSPKSKGEQLLLNKAGVNEGDRNIRNLLYFESDQQVKDAHKENLWQKIFRKKKKHGAKDATLDPEENKDARTYKNGKSAGGLKTDTDLQGRRICNIKDGMAVPCTNDRKIMTNFPIALDNKATRNH